MAFGILLSAVFDLTALDVKLVGPIPSGLPSLSLPDLSLISALWPSALGIALMSFVESIAAGRAFVRRGDPTLDPSQELVALGMANIGGGFTQAYPAGGGTSQTAVNNQAGAKSQMAEIVTAGMVVITMLFLAPLISLMPEATLGALVLVAAAGLIKIGEFCQIREVRNIEFAWAIVAFIGVILLGTLEGILVAVVVSLLHIIYLSNHPPVHIMGRKPGTDIFRPLTDHPDDETFPGLLMLHPVGLLYFSSVPRALEKMDKLIHQTHPRVVGLDCSAVANIEYTALQQLAEFEAKLQAEGVELLLVGLNPEALHAVERAPLGATLSHKRMFFNLETAVEAFIESEDIKS